MAFLDVSSVPLPDRFSGIGNNVSTPVDNFSLSAYSVDDSSLPFFDRRKYRLQEQSEQRQMWFNAYEAQKQRDFDERMSNTAYQRAVEDMKKAGLNPYAIGTSGASTPSGATASVSNTAYRLGVSSASQNISNLAVSAFNIGRIIKGAFGKVS